MKKIRKLLSTIIVSFVIILGIFLIGIKYAPESIAQTFGFRTYVVLTDSMEPRIPTFSLVISKNIPMDDELMEDTIITFKAERNGENVMLTHYYRRQQMGPDGKIYYRTQPERIKDEYDPYFTSRSDIIGKYLFHIPYVGKLILFLQSKFGFLMYAELFLVWCVNKLIKARWGEKDKEKEEVVQIPDIKK